MELIGFRHLLTIHDLLLHQVMRKSPTHEEMHGQIAYTDYKTIEH